MGAGQENLDLDELRRSLMGQDDGPDASAPQARPDGTQR